MKKPTNDALFTRNAMDAAIKIGFLMVWLIWSYHIVKPFIVPVLWGVIIAVAVFPIYHKLVMLLHGRDKLAALLVTMGLLVLFLTPSVFIGKLLVENVQQLVESLSSGDVTIPPPAAGLETWPIIGKPLVNIWQLASENLQAALKQLAPQIKIIGGWLVSITKGAGIGFLQFFFAVILAGIILAKAAAGRRMASSIAKRVIGDRGIELTDLAEQTVRSVANGVLGVAIIQALLAGLGFYVVGVPAVGFWTFLCLVLGIIQIGVNPVTIPMMIYVFLHSDTTTGVLFIIWSLFIGILDNVLKPILLGRGVDLPIAVIFVGAIGGLLLSGIIGLFYGAVVLALVYKLFQMWLEPVLSADDTASDTAAPESSY